MTSKLAGAFAVVMCVVLGACATLDGLVANGGSPAAGQNSESRLVDGLREALRVASERASEQVGQADGYLQNPRIRIPLPETLQSAATQLRRFGFDEQVDHLEVAMNRAAEAAADEAVEVFSASIRRMRPADVYAVFQGGDTAATQYLRDTSETELRQRYQPIVAGHLQRVQGVDLYQEIATAWNRLPGARPLETDLEGFVTDQALDGLFSVIAREEQRIREDPVARTTAILRDVFGSG